MARLMRDPAVKSVASRAAAYPAEQGYEPQEITSFIQLQEPPRPSDEQGVGKTPGFQWPWQRRFQSLVPAKDRERANWPNHRLTPPRPEQSGWGAQYLLFYEQVNRHAWVGGFGAPQQVIEHPETLPLTAFARRLI